MAFSIPLAGVEKSGTVVMKAPLVPTAAAFELRTPFKVTPVSRFPGEKSRVVGVSDIRLARLPLLMLETSMTEIEPGRLVPLGTNSASLTTMSFAPSGEKLTLSG